MPRLQVTATREGDGVTTVELFFDLVYAFAFTQVTSLMAHGHAPGSVLDGLIVLSLLWFSWCSFAWLANQARASGGVLRLAFVVATIAVFITCLALPAAFHSGEHGLDAAVVVVVCYAVVRVTHAGVYLVAARGEPALRRQVIVALLSSGLPAVTLLAVGAAATDSAQRWIWLAAMAWDFAAIFISASINQGWQLPSAAHFAERHGLIVLLALGESIIAIATGLGEAHLDGRVLSGAVLSILVAVGLFHAYFARLPEVLESALDAASGRARATLGRDACTYLHFPVIAGVILTALGIEQAMAHLDADHLGALGGWALGAGAALYLAAVTAVGARCRRQWRAPRILAGGALLVLAPVLVDAGPLPAVGIVAAVVGTLAVLESAARQPVSAGDARGQ